MEKYAKFMTVATIAAVMMFAAAAMMLTVQTVKAFVPTCSNCAKDFAPGIEQKSPGEAKNVAPGQEAQIPVPTCSLCAKDFAPGQEKKDLQK